jgi:hypothetical protein
MDTSHIPDAKELRSFGLVTGAIFAGIFGLLFPLIKLLRHGEFHTPVWPWCILVVLGSWALVHPASLIHVHRPWMKMAEVLGWINTRIILGLLFFLVILPIGTIMRLLGNDPMARRFDRKMNSYRVNREPPDREHMETPY